MSNLNLTPQNIKIKVYSNWTMNENVQNIMNFGTLIDLTLNN